MVGAGRAGGGDGVWSAGVASQSPVTAEGVWSAQGHSPGRLAQIDLAGEGPPECAGVTLRPEVRHRRLGHGLPGSDRPSVSCSRIAHEVPFPRGGSGSARFEERRPDQPTLRHFASGSKGLIAAACVRSGLRRCLVAVAPDQPLLIVPPAGRRSYAAAGGRPRTKVCGLLSAFSTVAGGTASELGGSGRRWAVQFAGTRRNSSMR